MATSVTAAQLSDAWQDAATQTQPDFSSLVSKGFAQDGDPVQGTNATLPGAAWFNLISAIRVSVILAAGKTPATTPDPLQFLQALQSLGWIVDKSVTTAMLADALVTATQLANNSVETAKIKDLAVTSAKLANLGVTNAKIADEAVTTSKLADGSVTPEKLADLDINDLPESWLNALMPAGQYLEMAGTELPTRTLLCNGSVVSRTTYSRLFAAIGTRYGAGDGSSTFKLPDANGRVLQGTTDLEQVGQYLEASLPNITGAFYSVGAADGAFYNNSTGYSNLTAGNTYQANWTGFNASKSSSVYTGTLMQPKAVSAVVCVRF